MDDKKGFELAVKTIHIRQDGAAVRCGEGLALQRSLMLALNQEWDKEVVQGILQNDRKNKVSTKPTP
ncbi:MAG: hypothetical protein PHU77_13900 [Simplicispira sp.]|nr:hypothetical protein [Simplicispira sp.]